MRLAIVDDDDDVRRALVRLLSSMGHKVIVFASAEDFEADSVAVDCLIVDVCLPGLSGVELQERVRDRPKPVPVVLISGRAERFDRLNIEKAQVVAKPFDESTLMAAIADAISLLPPVGAHHAD